MNLPVYEEKKEEKRERKTRKVCESNARFPNRALNTRAQQTKEKRSRDTKNDAHAGSSQTACFRPLSLFLSLPLSVQNKHSAREFDREQFCGVHFDFFFLRDEKNKRYYRKVNVTRDSRSFGRTRTRGEQLEAKVFCSKTKALYTRQN